MERPNKQRMSVDAAKKASIEKKIVVGLLVLFGLTLGGALKGVVGTHVSPSVSAPATVTSVAPTMMPSVRQTVMEAIAQQEEMVASSQASPSTAPSQRRVSVDEPLYTAQDLRDPMRSLLPQEAPKITAQSAMPTRMVETPPEEPPPPLRVRGILWSGTDAQAIINDNVYRIGEMVAGVKILAIDHRGVTVEYRGAPMLYTTASPTTDAGRAPTRQARWR